MRHAHGLLLVALAACGGSRDPLACQTMTGAAERLSIEIASLAEGDLSPSEPVPTGPGEVLQTQEAWAAAVERWGNDGALTPSFPADVVFVNRWVSDGCDGVWVSYAGWHEEGRLRLVIDNAEPGSRCDLDAPMLDLIVVPRRGATDIAWCAPAAD